MCVLLGNDSSLRRMQSGTNIVLIGFMGSGKSTVSYRLSKRLEWNMFDTDRLVEERAGLGIPDIFASLGEQAFRDLETEVLQSLKGTESSIIATGGGVILREENRELLRELGFTVWLTASPEILFERVSRTDHRPLLRTSDPQKALRELFASRERLYMQTADCVVDSSNLNHQAVVDIVLARAGQYFGDNWRKS